MSWRKNFSQNVNSSVDIKRKIIWEIPDNSKFGGVGQNLEILTSRHYLEFIKDCLVDIGEYKTFDTSAYPTIIKLAGERIYAFPDKTRGGYVFDHQFDGYKLNMFIPIGAVKRIF